MEDKTNSKIISLDEAVSLLKPGMNLALGGMNLYRRPVSFVKEIIKKKIDNLTLINFTAGFESDLLVGAGLVSIIRTCYFGLEGFGLAPMFTKFANEGKVKIIEETEASLAFGLRAKLANVSFMPARGLLCTDILKVRKDLKLVSCPYTGNKYVAYPPIDLDFAVIHTQMSDKFGNAVIEGNLAIDREIGIIAKTTILTTEKIVETDVIQKNKAQIITTAVQGVVESPQGATPTSCYPYYPIDGKMLLEYLEYCWIKNDFEGFLKKYIG